MNIEQIREAQGALKELDTLLMLPEITKVRKEQLDKMNKETSGIEERAQI